MGTHISPDGQLCVLTHCWSHMMNVYMLLYIIGIVSRGGGGVTIAWQNQLFLSAIIMSTYANIPSNVETHVRNLGNAFDSSIT